MRLHLAIQVRRNYCYWTMQLAGHRIGHLRPIVLVARRMLVMLVAAHRTLVMLVAAHQIGQFQPMQLAMLVLYN